MFALPLCFCGAPADKKKPALKLPQRRFCAAMSKCTLSITPSAPAEKPAHLFRLSAARSLASKFETNPGAAMHVAVTPRKRPAGTRGLQTGVSRGIHCCADMGLFRVQRGTPRVRRRNTLSNCYITIFNARYSSSIIRRAELSRSPPGYRQAVATTRISTRIGRG